MIDLEKLKTITEIAEAGFTIAAIVTAGVWTYLLFISKRQRYPRGNIEHSVLQRQLPEGKTLVHVKVLVKNIGEVLIRLVYAEVRLLQVLPLVNNLDNLINEGIDPVVNGRSDIDWPQLLSRDPLGNDTCEIEPGETEEFHCDFVIDSDVHTVQLYSFFRNELKSRRSLGWSSTTFHDIGAVADSLNM